DRLRLDVANRIGCSRGGNDEELDVLKAGLGLAAKLRQPVHRPELLDRASLATLLKNGMGDGQHLLRLGVNPRRQDRGPLGDPIAVEQLGRLSKGREVDLDQGAAKVPEALRGLVEQSLLFGIAEELELLGAWDGESKRPARTGSHRR